MCSSENRSSLSLSFLLLSIHSSLWGRKTVFAMVTTLRLHPARRHTGFGTGDNDPHPQIPACRAIAKVRSHRGLMLCSSRSLRFLFWERSPDERPPLLIKPSQTNPEKNTKHSFLHRILTNSVFLYRSQSYTSTGETCLNGNVVPNYILPHLRTIYWAPKNVPFITALVGIFLFSDFQMDFQSFLTQLQLSQQVVIEICS